MDIQNYISRHKRWSLQTFGEGEKTEGILKHIEEEISEVREAASSLTKFGSRQHILEEVIDVIILAIDLAWRLGFNPREIEEALAKKQIKNHLRKWPEIGSIPDDQPTKHLEENNESKAS